MAYSSKHTFLHNGFQIKSPAMKKVYAEIADYAYHGRPCILFGPSGSGKEYVARYYHVKFSEGRGGKSTVPFKPLNCACLSGTLAHSELFGHLKGAFTDAVRDKAGLFEEAKGGVLFLDEVGDLSADVQAMLLRAIDPETSEARRLGSTESYSTKDVTVICATEQPKGTLRPALLDRLEKQVFVPGIDKRPEDIPPAVEFFSFWALIKRRDVGILMEHFYGITKKEFADNSRENSNLRELSQSISQRLVPLASRRSWPGNFRALRVAVDTAVIRSRISSGKEIFFNEVVMFFREHQDIYSIPLKTISSVDITRPHEEQREFRKAEEMDQELLNIVQNSLPRINETEKHRIALFLSSRKEKTFSCNELCEALPNMKKRTVQGRLKNMEKSGIIIRSGGRGDRYRLALSSRTQSPLTFERPVFLPLPPDREWPQGRQKELDALHDLLKNSRVVFIGGEAGVGKTSCAQALCDDLSQSRAVYYYPFGHRGFSRFLEIIEKELLNRGIINSPVINLEDAHNPSLQVASLSGYIQALFGEKDRPVLIFDNTDLLSEITQKEALITMIRYWKNLTFVLVGKKLDNELEKRGIAEYPIKPFVKGIKQN